jgi:hypothetical protein
LISLYFNTNFRKFCIYAKFQTTNVRWYGTVSKYWYSLFCESEL